MHPDTEDDLTTTLRWAEHALPPGHRIRTVRPLQGGWTSRMRRLEIEPAVGGDPYALVPRSFVDPFFVRHAPGLLAREAGVMRLLATAPVPTPRLLAVDATADVCTHPSLLMTHLPGAVRLDPADAVRRSILMAHVLAAIHAVQVTQDEQPRTYQAWTTPDRVRPPHATRDPDLWRRATDVLRRERPPHTGVFLHRDFHPGNVLFDGVEEATAITGVVDRVETSWGPADLDVAHCSTTLALLHGPDAGMAFADHYTAAGGTFTAEPQDHLYWRLLDALAFAPDAQKVAAPWRDLGRTDLTPDFLAERLEAYVRALFERYG